MEENVLRFIENAIVSLQAAQRAIIESQPQSPPSVAQEEKDGVCHWCKEKKIKGETIIRGIHERCYKIMKRSIQAGQLNEEFVITQGRIAPKKPSGRKVESDVLTHLIEENEKAQAAENQKGAVPKKKGPKKSL